MFTVSNLIGHLPPTLLEVKTSPSQISQCKVDADVVLKVMTTLVGSVLMITAGALAVNHYSGYSYTRNYHYEVSSEF